jgi:prevent-host-death family protein
MQSTMINLSQDIQSLSTFKRNTNELITQMKETGNPVILTVNGKAELVVQNAISYQKLLDSIEHLETIIGIKKGLEDITKGDTQSLNEFIKEMQEKQEISS